jgi:hypothetical protein
MRTAKFNVPVEVLTDFLDAVSDKELNSTVVSKTEDVCHLEVDFDKDESSSIDELEEELSTFIENIDDEEEDED